MKLVFAKKKVSFLSRTLLIIISIFFAKKRLLFYLEHYFLFYFDREQIDKKNCIFLPKQG